MENRYGGNIRGWAEFSRTLPRVSIALGFFPRVVLLPITVHCSVKDIPGASLSLKPALDYTGAGTWPCISLNLPFFGNALTRREGGATTGELAENGQQCSAQC